MQKLYKTAFAQFDLKNAVITIQDGGSLSVEATIGEGTLTFSEKQAREYTLDRGSLDTVRNGDDQPVDVSFDFTWETLIGHGSGVASIEDALKRRGTWAAAVSTDADACAPYAVDIVITYTPTPTGCGQAETITLPDFRWEELNHDAGAGTVSCTGKCNVTQATVA